MKKFIFIAAITAATALLQPNFASAQVGTMGYSTSNYGGYPTYSPGGFPTNWSSAPIGNGAYGYGAYSPNYYSSPSYYSGYRYPTGVYGGRMGYRSRIGGLGSFNSVNRLSR